MYCNVKGSGRSHGLFQKAKLLPYLSQAISSNSAAVMEHNKRSKASTAIWIKLPEDKVSSPTHKVSSSSPVPRCAEWTVLIYTPHPFLDTIYLLFSSCTLFSLSPNFLNRTSISVSLPPSTSPPPRVIPSLFCLFPLQLAADLAQRQMNPAVKCFWPKFTLRNWQHYSLFMLYGRSLGAQLMVRTQT